MESVAQPAFSLGDESRTPVLFAGLGDVHGHMMQAVRMLREWEGRNSRELSFVLQVGDFEPHRDLKDLESNPCPLKYRHVGDFPMFADGDESFPWPVVFIGGNHEPWEYLEQYPGGEQLHRRDGALIPNCYYLGRTSWVRVFGMRVGGISGHFANEVRFLQERLSPDRMQNKDVSLKRFSYIRRGDIERARRIAEGVVPDAWIFHDWPETDLGRRLGPNPHYAGKAANPHTLQLIEEHPAQLVLCGHMHARRIWSVPSADGQSTIVNALGYVPGADPSAFAIFEWDCAAREIRAVLP